MKCSFESLCAYLNDQLNERRNHEVFAHLQECEICLEAVVTMLQDRDFAKCSASVPEIHSPEPTGLPMTRQVSL